MSTTATDTYKIAVIGAGGKMGMRVSNNLVKTDHTVWYVENSPSTRAAPSPTRPRPSPTPTSSCTPCPILPCSR